MSNYFQDDPIIQKQAQNVIQRDNTFTTVLENFAEHQKNKDSEQRKQKKAFFWIVCISFIVVVVGCLAAIIVIAAKENVGWEELGVALASVGSLISVIIVLPTKIAEHLFPANGEKDITDFFIKIHETDIKVTQETYSTQEEANYVPVTDAEIDALFGIVQNPATDSDDETVIPPIPSEEPEKENKRVDESHPGGEMPEEK